MPSLYALCTPNEGVRLPTTVTTSIGHDRVALKLRSWTYIMRCPLRTKRCYVNSRSICTKWLYALCTPNEGVRLPTTVTTSIGHDRVALKLRSWTYIMRCPLRTKRCYVNSRGICTKWLLISINDILLLDKYKPACMGEFFV